MGACRVTVESNGPNAQRLRDAFADINAEADRVEAADNVKDAEQEIEETGELPWLQKRQTA